MEFTGLSLSWRKALLSGIGVLLVTLALMMYRDHQGPGDGYQTRVDRLHVESAVHAEKFMAADIKSADVVELFRDKDLFPSIVDTDRLMGITNNKAVAPTEPCDTCCYRYVTIDQDIVKTLTEIELRERGCQKRLPDALIFGVKKGGTTSLRNFISYHPDIAFTNKELKFFTSNTEFRKGLEYYRSQMIHSTPGQVSMEKTPAYYHYPKVPSLIRNTLPNVKLIIIMRDPVERAVSDFVHMQVTIDRACPDLKPSTNDAGKPMSLSSACFNNSAYFIADTFENSVIDFNGDIRFTNQLISKGVYVKDIQRYRKYFQNDQILALDGEAFINDPYPTVKKVERFLGVRDYFSREHFYFDTEKGFFCLNKPIPNNCMSPAKGRPHPDIREETLDKLRQYYRPYNQALNELMNVDFQWSS